MSHDLRWPRQRPVNGENAGESPEGFARRVALDLPEGLCPKVVGGSGRTVSDICGRPESPDRGPATRGGALVLALRDSQLHGDVARHRHVHGHTWSMARKVSIADARNHLTVLIHDVERGKKVELTRRGKRVAVLVSCDEYDRLRATRPSLDQALQAWRARLPADFEGFSDDDVRSWRDPSPGREVRFG